MGRGKRAFPSRPQRGGGWSLSGKLVLTGICLLSALLGALFLLPRDKQAAEAPLRVGAGDDVTGVLLSEVEACAERGDRENLLIGSYLFVDCCASAAQWALQAEEIDLGFYCAQAALEMVNHTDAFEIYGPIVQNGEVIACLDPQGEMEILGLPRKRIFLRDFAEKTYPRLQSYTELNRAYLLFALESGEVDGAVVDVADAHRAGEDVRFLPTSETPYISYCLVVRRDIKETGAFMKFLDYYEEAVNALNEPERLVSVMGMDEDFWALCGTEFLHLP